MSQHLEPTHDRPSTAKVPMLDSPETLDVIGSMSANPDGKLPHIDAVETDPSTQHNHDADTKLTPDDLLTSIGSDTNKENANAANASQDSSGNAKDAEGDDLEEAEDDVLNSFWKIQWDKYYNQTYEQRKKKALPWLRHSLCNDILLNERVDIIEKVLATKGFLSAETSTEDTIERKILRSEFLSPIKLDWFAFTSCDVDKLEATCFAVLLVEKPIRSSAERFRRARKGHDQASASKTLDENARVERIRFPTLGGTHVLDEIMEFEVPGRMDAILRPFKPLFAYLSELQRRYGDIKRPNIVNNEHVVRELSRSDPNLGTRSDESTKTPAQQHDQDEEETREHNKSVTAQAMLNLMRKELKDDMNIHLDCRGRKKSLLQFDDTWHLFFPGDIVYDPKLDQALRVLCVQNGRTVLDLNADFIDGRPELQGAKNALVVLVFGIDFDGRTFGPSQRSYNLEPWEGEQTITSLPIYPIEYARTESSEPESVSSTKQEALQERGRKFCEIVNTPQVAHRQYRGFNIETIREQVSEFGYPIQELC